MQWRVGREIGILKHMKHPRINALHGVIDTPDRLFILLQVQQETKAAMCDVAGSRPKQRALEGVQTMLLSNYNAASATSGAVLKI